MTGFCIGQVNIDGRFIMAPMAGVTDRAFRQICRECGAAMTVSEEDGIWTLAIER